VPLIFLDTPQIALLEEERRSDPVRYFSFCHAWKERGYTLVLTITQAGELCRYGNASRREGRYQVLADLAPIRTDWWTVQGGPAGPQTLIEREILRAVVDRGLIPATCTCVDRLRQWTEVLPAHLNAGDAGLLRVLMENQDYRKLENQMYDAARFGAAANKLDGQRKKLRARDLPDAPVPPEKGLDCWAGFEKAISLLKEQSRIGKLPPVSEDLLKLVRDFFEEFLGRAQGAGPRATLQEYLHVSGATKPDQLKLTTHELVNRSVFEHLVRVVARELLGASDSEQGRLARTLHLADCPGSWLDRRLRLCVQRGSSEPAPSHHHDAQRLAYLPYVDLLFTDAEMVEFVRQVRSDEAAPERIRALQPPVAIPRSLEALEGAIDSLDFRRHDAASDA
jgi:hypothetical protein